MPRAVVMISCACGCGKEFPMYDNKGRKRQYISGHNTIVHNPRKKDMIEQVCVTCGKHYFRNPSLANRGRNTYCSNECRSKNAKEWMGGYKNPKWKGGFNGVQSLRWCPEYRTWRNQIFKRDNYTCQVCEEKGMRFNPLHVHHVIPFSESIEFRFEQENGVTVCKRCHFMMHTKKKEEVSHA